MGIETIAALGIGAVGSYMNARSQNKATDANNARQTDLSNKADQYFQNSPSDLEQMIQSLYGQGAETYSGDPNFQIPNISKDLNASTDPILQSLRKGPNTAFLTDQLRGMTETGNPFDTNSIIDALYPVRQRNLNKSVADLQASAPGLGSRFGSAQLNAEQELRRQTLEDTNAADSQLTFAGHESAQNRRLGAAGQLLGVDQQGLQRDQTALQALFSQAGLGMQQAGLGLQAQQLPLEYAKLNFAGKGQQQNLLQMLLGAQGQRQGNNSNLLAILGGLAPAQASGYGGAATDISQLLMLSQLFGKQAAPAAATT